MILYLNKLLNIENWNKTESYFSTVEAYIACSLRTSIVILKLLSKVGFLNFTKMWVMITFGRHGELVVLLWL